MTSVWVVAMVLIEFVVIKMGLCWRKKDRKKDFVWKGAQ
jgi:hypothetical protein